MKLEKRSTFGWGASAASAARPTQGLVIHYDGANQGLAGKSHEACRTYWRSTRQFHMGSSRGWADIGYSFGACPHGVVLEGRGLGRTQAAQPGGNSTWYSVTLMGGPAEQPTDAQINAVRQLRAWLMSQGVGAGVRGHRDFIETSCPGDRAYKLVRDGVFARPAGEEDDMPLSKDDLEQIRKVVWESDRAAVPPGVDPKDNPNWQYINLLRETYGRTLEIRGAVLTLAGQSPDVDESEIVAGVLAGLTPERIAAAIPAELAEQVVEALADRITNEPPKEGGS